MMFVLLLRDSAGGNHPEMILYKTLIDFEIHVPLNDDTAPLDIAC